MRVQPPPTNRGDERVLTDALVAVAAGHHGYGGGPPFSPGADYPEYPFPRETRAAQPNPAYAGVRRALQLGGLDAERFDTPAWNPLGEIIRPGDTVVIKPNFVRDFRESGPDTGDCLITHGAVLRAVLDYVHLAVGERGRMIVADAPQNDADFARLRALAGLDELCAFYGRYTARAVDVFDLRPSCADKIDGVIVGHQELPGDPAGYARINLAEHSAFAEINHLCDRLYGAEYEVAELHTHQHEGVHEYLIARTVLAADVLVSVPKLKTHKKVGLTVNLKNLVGINGNKNWLPHHRIGTLAEGGDEFAHEGVRQQLERRVLRQFRRVFPRLGPLRRVVARPIKAAGRRLFGDTNAGTIRSGNWFGNDTAWRMVLDLNRLLLYADAEGRLHDRVQRRFFSIVDGIVAGEGNGPLDPVPRQAGLVLAGGNPVAVDLACARLAGFDYQQLPVIWRAFGPHDLPLVGFQPRDVILRSNQTEWNRALTGVTGRALAFRPHFGWIGQVEMAEPRARASVAL